MKYLQSFFESLRFSHLQEVITEIKELSLFLKDEGFEISFGIMPSGLSMPDYANFDDQGSGTNLGDIQLKMISLGKMVSFYKINLSNTLQPDEPYEILFTTGKKYRDNCLNDEQKEMVCDVVLSVVDLFRREGIVVVGFWYKSSEEQRHLDRFFRTNFSFVDLEKLLDAIKIGIASDIRIAFTGQKLLDESLTPKLEMSELMDIEEIVKDYNEELDEVTISASYVPAEADDVQEILYIIINSIEGFDLYLIKDFLLTLMNHIGVDNLDLKIVYLYDSYRQSVKVTKKELEIGTVHPDKIVSIVITFDL
jgi:hypothetical protein